MLSELYIENVAVIEQARVAFLPGLNVLTGETGAGKSILIDSINAIQGNRTTKDIVRSGCDKAVIWASFEQFGPEVGDALVEYGYGDEEPLIIQREIQADGGSRYRINQRPASALAVREICASLINIHGQHDNQELLNADRHIYVFDRYTSLTEEVREFSGLFREAEALKKRINSIKVDDAQKQRQMDLLRYQADEIQKANLIIGEDEELSARRDAIRNFEFIRDSLNSAGHAFSGEEGEKGLIEASYGVMNLLEGIAKFKDEYKSVHGLMNEAYYTLTDISERINAALVSFEYDTSQIHETEERLDVIFRLKRKYGESIEDIFGFLKSVIDELESIESGELMLDEMEEEYSRLLTRIESVAGALSLKRQGAFKRFEDEIKSELAYLNMENADFRVVWTKTEIGALGSDRIEFYLSTNKGESPRPLSRIASGGELSRIMLAIKNTMAEKDDIGTLIFDEIDTGISGNSAFRIGNKLKQSAGSRQTICVTHSAQIASFADNHFLISKDVRSGRTYTSVQILNYEGRKHELARIISGDSITEISLKNADELLRRANTGELEEK